MTTLATPLVMTDPELVNRNRTVKYRWVLHQEDVEEHNDHGVRSVYVTLDVTHYGRAEIYGRPEYCFVACLMYEDITRFDRGITKQSFQYLGGVLRLSQIECKRFSQKRLAEFAEMSLVDLRNRRDDPVIQSMFAGQGTEG